MRIFGVISVVSFFISLMIYASWFFNEELFSKSAMLVATVLPVIGIITAIFTRDKPLKLAGVIGNSLVLLWAVVIPITSALFWNTP